MEGWLRLLVLGAIPILAVTMVANQGLAADKGSQLIFMNNMAHHNFISVANANDDQAVTVLVQYYNDGMEMVLWYLNVIPGGGNILVDPYNHMIPGSDPARNAGDYIMESGNANSGHFVIAVTAVGANVQVDDVDPTTTTVNVLFPDFLAAEMHGMDNIDNCGAIQAADGGTDATNHLEYTEQGEDGEDDCTAGTDVTSKNVGGLKVTNAMPISFDHLAGHFTEALIGTDAGGGDQTASWGGTPITRPTVTDTANAGTGTITEYTALNGTTGRLAEKDAGGQEVASVTTPTTRSNYTEIADVNEIANDAISNRGLTGGALVLPALHGGGDETKQIMLILSAADDGLGSGGKYKLVPAKTGLMVTLHDNMGDALPDPTADSAPVFGGPSAPDTPPGTKIIVDGIQVMTDAGDCGGDMIMGPWTLDHLTSIVPTASSGAKTFDGLDAMLDPMMNASPGLIKFKRAALKCEMDYGDGDDADGSDGSLPDGVPISDEREYAGGTLIVEEANSDRSFVIMGRALLKFITAESTFAASWTLKSPATSVD